MKNKIIQEEVSTSNGILKISLIEDLNGGYTGFFDSYQHIVAEGDTIDEIKKNLIVIFEEVKKFEKDLF